MDQRLRSTELERLADHHDKSSARIILCCGEYLRYQLMWQFHRGLASIVPEAVARLTVPRMLSSAKASIKRGPKLRVEVAAASSAYREFCAIVCRKSGLVPVFTRENISPFPKGEASKTHSTVILIWQVPLDDLHWLERLEEASSRARWWRYSIIRPKSS